MRESEPRIHPFVKMKVTEKDVENIYERDMELKKEDIEFLKLWIEKQPHLPKITELQIILFFHSCYYKIEPTKSAIDTFFTVRTLCPDLFQSRSLKDPAILKATETSLVTALPNLTPNGDLVFFAQLDKHPENFNITTQIKLFDTQLLIELTKKGPVQGLHIIMDLKNVVVGHFLKVSASLLTLKKFLYLLQEGLPVRMKYVHVLNVVSFMDKILTLFKPLIKKELYNCIVLHKDVDTLLKYVPRDLLPEEYGGTCDTIDSLKEKVKLTLKENEDLIEFQENQLVDESKRIGISKNVNEMFGVQGNFKKLDID